MANPWPPLEDTPIYAALRAELAERDDETTGRHAWRTDPGHHAWPVTAQDDGPTEELP